MTRSPTLILASTSPRRREVLASLELDFVVVPVDVDESPRDGETPGDMALRLAVAKARAAEMSGDGIVLGADTVVVIDERALGKPKDEADCLAMLELLGGRVL